MNIVRRTEITEGVWTPVVTSTGGSGITHSTQFGRWTKIGKLVLIKGRVVTSGASVVGGNVDIEGLPFKASSLPNDFGGVFISFASSLLLPAGGFQPVGNINTNSFQIDLRLWSNTGTNPLLHTQASATADFIFHGQYYID